MKKYYPTTVISGYDVFKGKTFIGHFSTYDEAWAHASKGRGCWVRYWEKEYRLVTIAGQGASPTLFCPF